jgi:hypothetical protein
MESGSLTRLVLSCEAALRNLLLASDLVPGETPSRILEFICALPLEFICNAGDLDSTLQVAAVPSLVTNFCSSRIMGPGRRQYRDCTSTRARRFLLVVASALYS